MSDVGPEELHIDHSLSVRRLGSTPPVNNINIAVMIIGQKFIYESL
jgi:hypothetical protein